MAGIQRREIPFFPLDNLRVQKLNTKGERCDFDYWVGVLKRIFFFAKEYFRNTQYALKSVPGTQHLCIKKRDGKRSAVLSLTYSERSRSLTPRERKRERLTVSLLTFLRYDSLSVRSRSCITSAVCQFDSRSPLAFQFHSRLHLV